MSSRDFDPFGEHSDLPFERRLQLLGARIRFRSNSRKLLQLVDHAYAGLPRHRLKSDAPELNVTLILNSKPRRKRGPKPFELQHGDGLLAASTADCDYAVLAPREAAALIVVPEKMLRFPYQTRYELIEFTVFTLAARSQSLVPLHGACVGIEGRGVLLLGDTGAGKSTLSLQCLLNDFEFLSEDSVFVQARTMLATGAANFLHVTSDTLRWVAATRVANAIRRSPVIQRRSGVRKFEWDLRRTDYSLAQAPLRIAAVAFLSAQSARAGMPLHQKLSPREAAKRLATLQQYGSSRPTWGEFARNAAALPAFELLRGRHPAEAALALKGLLMRR